MSINSKQTVKCPSCGELGEVNVWNIITVHDSPDLKADLLAGKINMFRCGACGHSALMTLPLLYYDWDKKLMILFSPCAEERRGEAYRNMVKISKESGSLKNFSGYNLRLVTEYNELLEKILIFDNGLNDKAVEVIKLMILSQDVEKADFRTCRFGKLDNGTLEFMIYDKKENRVYTSAVPKESYDTVYAQLRESGVKPYSFGWEMVDSSYATRLLNGFNN